jgi:hypothetical protein
MHPAGGDAVAEPLAAASYMALFSDLAMMKVVVLTFQVQSWRE